MSFFGVYDTQRYVRVQSYKLGLTWWILVAAVIVGSVFQLIINQGYRKHVPLDGIVNLIVKEGKNESERIPCGQNLSCKKLSAFENVVYMDRNNIAFSLRMDDTYIESLPLLKMSHFVHDDIDEDLHVNGRRCAGKLIDNKGRMLKTFPKNDTIHISLWELLRAANVNLDDMSSFDPEKSIRDTGFEIFVSIQYTNSLEHVPFLSMGVGEFTYKMSVHFVKDSENKIVKKVGGKVTKFYNVMVNVSTKAEKIVFCGFLEILQVIGSALGFITVITLLVDYMALLLIPEKRVFEKSKFEHLNLHMKKEK